MPKVGDIATYVRSKSAGPFWVTLEIFCKDDESYQMMKNSPNISKEAVSGIYAVDPEKMKCFYMDDIFIIKFSYPRSKPCGHKYENDMHNGQQYIRLSEVEV